MTHLFVANESHLCWYIKIPLNDDLSLRYYLVFEDRKELERKWILKSHSEKKYGEVSKSAVELLCKLFGVDEEEYEEIVSRKLPNGVYTKTIVNRKIDRTDENDKPPLVRIIYELDDDIETICGYKEAVIDVKGLKKNE